MCSRFWGSPDGFGVRIETAAEARGGRGIAEREDLDSPNVAPTEFALVTHVVSGERIVTPMAWGFRLTGRPIMINARIETALERSLFKEPARSFRGLIMVRGFFEWEKPSKQPFCIARSDRRPYPIAVLCRNESDGPRFVICTGPPNDLVAKIHDRMPCAMEEAEAEIWLSSQDPTEAIAAAIQPYPCEQMEMYPVTRAMSNPRYKGLDATEPLPKGLFD